MPFTDYQTALVTGANTGMGAAITDRLTKHGPRRSTAVARNAARLDDVASRTGMRPARGRPHRHRRSRRRGRGPPDRHAGQQRRGLGHRQHPRRRRVRQVDAMVDVNLRAVLHLCRLLLPGMVERDLGHVVNISSIAGAVQLLRPHRLPRDQGGRAPVSRQLRNDRSASGSVSPRSAPAESRPRSSAATSAARPKPCEEAWETYYEGYESITTDDIADTIEFALDAPGTSTSASSRSCPPSRSPAAWIRSAAPTE